MHARSLYMILMLLLAGMGTSAQFGDVPALRTVPDQVVDSLQKTKYICLCQRRKYYRRRKSNSHAAGPGI